jgi:hypothetical protein
LTDTKTAEKPEAEIKVTEHDDGSAVVHLPEGIADEPKKSSAERAIGRDPDDDVDGDDTSGGGRKDGDGERMSANKRRRLRQKAKRDESQGQLYELTQVVHSQQRMLQALTRGQQVTALQTLEREASDARSAYAEAQRRHAEAIEKGDGKAAAEAMTVITNATTYYNNVAQQHKQLVEHIKKSTPADDGGGGGGGDGGGDDPRSRRAADDGAPQMTRKQLQQITEKRDAFLDRNPDIDPDSDDPKNIAIKAIDNAVRRDGFQPYTDDYWDELEERAQEAGLLKKGKTSVRRDDDQDDPPRRRETSDGNGHARRRARDDDDDDDRGGPPIGGGGRPNNGGGGRDLALTPQMVNALEQANIPLSGGGPEMVKRRNNILKQWATKPN